MSKEHIIMDTLKQYTICDSIPESIYPTIIYVNNNKIDKVEYYNTQNIYAYEKLKSYLY
jgi:hypothetical protein